MQFSAVEHKKAENGKSLKESKSNSIIERGLKSRYIAPLPKNKWDMITHFWFLNAFESMKMQCSCSWILIAKQLWNETVLDGVM